MNTQTINLITYGLKTLNKLGFDSNDIILTGSCALCFYGLLPKSYTPNDMDVIIKMSSETERKLKFLSLIYPINGSSTSYSSFDSPIKFKINGIVFNVWVNRTGVMTPFKSAHLDCYLQSPAKIIRKKTQYDRPKDKQMLFDIVRNLTTHPLSNSI